MRRIVRMDRRGDGAVLFAVLGWIGLFLLAGCSENGVSLPQTPPPGQSLGTVQGKVLASGEPLAGSAIVRLEPSSGNTQLAATVAGGRFVFPLVPSGSGRVTIVPPAGYGVAGNAAGTVTCDVSDGGTTEVVFDLELRGPVRPDSTGGGGEPRGLLLLRADLEGQPLDGLQVAAVAADGQRFESQTTAYYALPTGEYSIEAAPIIYGQSAPWLRILSIEPGTVTLAAYPPETEALIHVGYNPDVPVPLPELTVCVSAAVDSTNGGGAEPVWIRKAIPTPVIVYRSGTSEVVAQGNTGDAYFVTFSLPRGVYDVAIEVPSGYELFEPQESPARSIPVEPMGTSFAAWLLRQTR